MSGSIDILLNITQRFCADEEYLEHQKRGLRPDFYHSIKHSVRELQGMLITEMSETIAESAFEKEGYDEKDFFMEAATEGNRVLPVQEETALPENTDSAKAKQDSAAVAVVTQISPRQWKIKDGAIICQKQSVEVIRGNKTVPFTFHISPLEKVENGVVPLLVSIDYQSSYGIKQSTTSKSEPGSALLQMDVDGYSFLIKGSFTNEKFSGSVMSTGKSVEMGDIIHISAVQPAVGNETVPRIQLNADNALWISFSDDQYFGMTHSGEWLDEYNASHDVMLEIDGDYAELHASRTDTGWSLEY